MKTRGIRAALATWLVAALTAGLLAGCGGADAADRFRDLPGVRAASVERRALDTDYYAWDAVVDMRGDATAEQVAAVLDRLAAWRGADAGEERTTAVYLDAHTTRYDDGWLPEGASMARSRRSHAANLANARLLLAAHAALGGRVTIFGDDLMKQWRVQSPDMRATLRAIRADPVLSAAPRLVIEAPHARLGTLGPLTADWVAAYERSVTTLPKPKGVRTSVAYFGTPMDGEDFNPGARPGQLEILMALQMRERRARQLVNADAAADPRWPAVRSQLDVLAGRPAGSKMIVWLQYDAIGSEYRRIHDLVDLTLGRPVQAGKQPSWNDEAAAYLTD
ncbi:hypothetical protein [Nocardioides jejuensis]|uniref:Lipoprotein n=1 Tax=Nocardioides jejuensis TaxID=2502782 RepID=A0A4R1CHS4_9ACTN|nr:hypothetical protein [Nocardioides jejuensis]TCJ30307.1 hypothetical protein EPD65_03615 [Nocardioides jejuensis]